MAMKREVKMAIATNRKEKSVSRESQGSRPDPEVKEKKPKRSFTAQYKMRIVQEAQTYTKPGEIGSMLRREGLYSSHLTQWRKQYKEGLLSAFSPKKSGRMEQSKNPLEDKVKALKKENEELKKKLKQAEAIIDVQKKISEILKMSQD